MKNEEKTSQEALAEEEYRPGFTRTAFLAALYSIAVFIPASIYLTLMTGTAALPIAWFTLILWSEIAKISGKPLLKQEAFMIFMLAGWASFVPTGYVYSAWFRNSDIAHLFGLTNEIPYWVAPPPETGIYTQIRTLLHPAWIVPIVLGLITSVFGAIMTFALGLLGREIFVEHERLPFPLQKVSAETIVTLTSEKRFSIQLLSTCALVGFIYGFLVYALPFVLKAWTGSVVQIVPIPWIDLNRSVQDFLPGACLGAATDIAYFASAFVLPFPTVISIVIGSFAIYFFGNWLTVAYNLSPIPWYVPGMNMQDALQRSILYFWATPLIGVGLAVGIFPLIRHAAVVRRAINSILHPSLIKERLTDPVNSRKWIFMPLIVSLAASVMIFAVLVPGFVTAFPWIIPFFLVMPFVWTLIDSRLIGETGISISGTAGGNLNYLLYYASGYKGVDVWFAPTFTLVSGGGYVGLFEVARLTKTKVTDYIKAWWITYPLAFLMGFIYMEMFWRLAPIPSAAYPGVQIFWPISATYSALWIRGGMLGIFNPLWILFGFLIGGGIYAVTEFAHLPLSYIGLAAGAATFTPFALTYLVGAFIAKLFEMRTGKKWWSENKNIIAGGLVMGESVAITIGVAITLIINSIWLLPW